MLSWDYITNGTERVYKRGSQTRRRVLDDAGAKPFEQKEDRPQKEYLPSEYDDAILEHTDEYIRPAVETDGGAIESEILMKE